MTTYSYHTPVLAGEVLRYLVTDSGGLYIDGTLGGGGHSELILEQCAPAGRVIGFDRDEDAVRNARERLARFGDRAGFVLSRFSGIPEYCRTNGISSVAGLLLDLGVSSYQIDNPGRGFSFLKDGPIDMRMDRRQTLDGAAVIREYDERRLSDLLKEFGEERNAGRIARRIVAERRRNPVTTTGQLAEIVESAVGKRFLVKSLARVFQAIRIEVNGEMDELKQVLRDAVGLLSPGGRLVVLSYHSLEDRITKQFFRHESRTSDPSGSRFLPDRPVQPTLRILTPRPVVADESEQANNPRARSARLRAAERMV